MTWKSVEIWINNNLTGRADSIITAKLTLAVPDIDLKLTFAISHYNVYQGKVRYFFLIEILKILPNFTYYIVVFYLSPALGLKPWVGI